MLAARGVLYIFYAKVSVREKISDSKFASKKKNLKTLELAHREGYRKV